MNCQAVLGFLTLISALKQNIRRGGHQASPKKYIFSPSIVFVDSSTREEPFSSGFPNLYGTVPRRSLPLLEERGTACGGVVAFLIRVMFLFSPPLSRLCRQLPSRGAFDTAYPFVRAIIGRVRFLHFLNGRPIAAPTEIY